MKKTLSLLIVFVILVSMFTFVGSFAAETVLLDESFEGDITANWSYRDDYAKSNFKVVSDDKADGSKSLFFDDDTDKTSPVLKSKMFPATYGETFTISAAIKAVEGTAASVYFKFYDDNEKQLSGSGSVSSKATSWTDVKKTAAAPEGTVNIQLWITGGVAPLGKGYVDSVKLVKSGEAKAEPAPSTTPSTSAPATTTPAPKDAVIADSFEGDMSQWTYNNDYAKSNITVENVASDGKKSLLFNDDSDSLSPILKSKKIDAAYGETFTVTASFKTMEGARVSVYPKFYDENNKQLASTTVGVDGSDWKSVTKTVTAPDGTSYFQLWITGTLKGLGKCYVDNVIVTKSGEAKPSTSTSSSSSTSAPAVITPKGDILFQETFEGELKNWTFANDYAENQISVVSTTAAEGSKSLYVKDDSDTVSPVLKGPYIEVTPGQGYNVSASYKSEEGSLNKLFIKFFDKDKKQLTNVSFGTTGSSWHVASKLQVAPENAAYICVWISGVNKTTGSSYVDNIIISKASEEELEEVATSSLPAPKPIEGIPASNENFHIYLFIGQSNMVGADPIQKEDMVVVDGAYLYNNNSKWELAQPYPTSGSEYMGYNRYSSVSASGRTGPTIGFARTIVTKVPAGVKIGIISNAIGGTTVQQWSKGYGQYEDLPESDSKHNDRDLFEKSVERTKEAIAKGGVLKGIFYLQGESCASKETEYLYRLTNIANNLREEFGATAEELPFFVSEIPQIRATGVATIRKAPTKIENCHVISSEGLTIFDSIHFDVKSQRILGSRFAEMALDKVYGIKASADEMYNSIYKAAEAEKPADKVEYTILVNGKKLETDVPPHEAGGRLFVPVRAIFETLGATVSWDDATQTVTGVRGDRTVVMKIGDEHMTVNGVSTAMLIAPMLKDMRTLVPIRFVGEGLGATVGWDEKTFTATIDLK